MMSVSDKICDYHDVLLRRSDLELLEGSNWLNDQLISFYLEYLRQEKFGDSKDELLLLDPAAAFMLTAVAPEEVPLVLGSLKAPEKQMVIIPVNDNTAPDKADGGSHWSALCYIKPPAGLQLSTGETAGFFHCDSFSNSNITAAKRILPAARHLVGDTKASMVSAEVPQQRNCCDCGLFALAFAETLAALCVSGMPVALKSLSDKPSLQHIVEHAASVATQDVVYTMRGSIRELIQARSL